MLGIFPSFSTLLDYYEMGGFVMPPLVLISFVLWYALIYRAMTIRSSQNNPRELVRKGKKGKKKFYQLNSTTADATKFAVEKAKEVSNPVLLKALIDEEFARIKDGLAEHKTLVRSLVAIAPLLGLLGTVDGMIETFNSLGDMALFTQSGGIAGGISKALFTTQMGLAISIPGLLLGRMIERRERNVYRELDQVRDLVVAGAKNNP
ncbi:MAG: MotA/TolQ/ExbB proton channel family protein [Oleiphilus sp.]